MVISVKVILKIELSSTNWLLKITATKTGKKTCMNGKTKKSKASQGKKMETG